MITELPTIPLSAPDITEREIEAVVAVLKTPHLSLGPKLEEFERKFAAYTGSRYAVAVNSGTAALHLTVKGLGIGENDAVITTPFSFIASANCLLYEKTQPIFVDIEEDTWNIDPDRIEEYLKEECTRETQTGKPKDKKSGRTIKAILPVHVFGNPCNMDAILRIARSYGLYVIEDACEAIGAEFRGKRIGSIGDAGVFAFYPNKQITTGEGGMVVTDSHALAGFCRSARNQGRNEKASWLLHDTLGFNYRIPDINCALGIAQLERIDEILDKRRAVAAQYNLLLHDFGDIPAVLPEGKRSWFVYVLELSGGLKKADRDRILDSLRQQGISAGDYFPPIHLQPLYRDLFGFKPGSLPVTEALSGRTIALPFHSKLTDSEVVRVAQCLMTELAEKVPGRDGEMEKKFRKAVTAFKAKRRTRVA